MQKRKKLRLRLNILLREKGIEINTLIKEKKQIIKIIFFYFTFLYKNFFYIKST